MVIGHSIGPSFLCRFIYTFHMPLFFFCSGYFFIAPNTLSLFSHFALKKINGLYYPFVKWSAIFLLLHNLFYNMHFYPIDDYFGYYDIHALGVHFRSIITTMTGQDKLLDPFWFLKELLLASWFIGIITYFLNRVASKYTDWMLCIFLILLTFFTKLHKIGLPIIWDLSIMFLSSTFFVLGYIYHKVENKTYYNLFGVIISFILLLGFVLIWDAPLDMLFYNEYSVLLYIPMALVGIYLVFSLSYIMELYRIKRCFYYIGKNTLIILSLHLLAFKIASYVVIYFYGIPKSSLSETFIADCNIFCWFLYIIFGIGIPLLFHEFYRHIANKFKANILHGK